MQKKKQTISHNLHTLKWLFVTLILNHFHLRQNDPKSFVVLPLIDETTNAIAQPQFASKAIKAKWQ